MRKYCALSLSFVCSLNPIRQTFIPQPLFHYSLILPPLFFTNVSAPICFELRTHLPVEWEPSWTKTFTLLGRSQSGLLAQSLACTMPAINNDKKSEKLGNMIIETHCQNQRPESKWRRMSTVLRMNCTLWWSRCRHWRQIACRCKQNPPSWWISRLHSVEKDWYGEKTWVA